MRGKKTREVRKAIETLGQRKRVKFGYVSPAKKKCLDQLERALQRAIKHGVTDRKVFSIYVKLLRRADIETLHKLVRQEHQEHIGRVLEEAIIRARKI